MERKIGEKFKQGNVNLTVFKQDHHYLCKGCYYNHGALSDCFFKETFDNRGECRLSYREDKTDVVFREPLLHKNIRPITYISIALFTITFWSFVFKLIFGL